MWNIFYFCLSSVLAANVLQVNEHYVFNAKLCFKQRFEQQQKIIKLNWKNASILPNYKVK